MAVEKSLRGKRHLAVILFLLGIPAALAQAEPPPSPSGQTSGLERKLQTLLADHAHTSSDPRALAQVADLYLDLGDEAYPEESKRRAAYEEGARLARRAIDLEESNAHAHYLYAANLGSAAQLKGVMASTLTIRELKAHVRRALELKNDHAPALHMMGMMLEELPWFLGGDVDAALAYLQRAVAADPQYTHARLDLAKAYIKRRDTDSARRELITILSKELPPDQSVSEQRHRQEATQFLTSLEPQHGTAKGPRQGATGSSR